MIALDFQQLVSWCFEARDLISVLAVVLPLGGGGGARSWCVSFGERGMRELRTEMVHRHCCRQELFVTVNTEIIYRHCCG